MKKFDYDIAIIGGGAAGLTVAAGSARAGARTLLIDKGPALGGDCLHYGCVPSKTLIKTAQVYHHIKNSHHYGLPRIKAPGVDFSHVSARIADVIATVQKHDSVERFRSLGAEVVFGQPEFQDPHQVLLEGRRISARKWVVATGSSPAVPPVRGLESVKFWTTRDLFYLDDLPASMIILGAGPVAIEMAQAFTRLGTKVTIVQRSPWILSREDRDMSVIILDALHEEGTIFQLESTVSGVSPGHSGRIRVDIETGVEKRPVSLEADALLVAMGRAPNTTGLNLEKACVKHDRKGIAVDSRLRTSCRTIFAPGDINGAWQFTHAAGYEGGVVVTNAVFHLPKKANYTFMPRCIYSDPEFASVGMNEREARAAGIDYQTLTEDFRNNDRNITGHNTPGRIKLIINSSRRPLGVQIVGPDAGELVSEWSAALNGGIRLFKLGTSVHPYPTLAEINSRVITGLMSEKIFSPRIKKALKFLFGYRGRACGPDGYGA